VEHEFLDRFRADLAASTQCVELLSPFVSRNRSSDYYAVLKSLSVRSVPVKVYVRPLALFHQKLGELQSHIDILKIVAGRAATTAGSPARLRSFSSVWHGKLLTASGRRLEVHQTRTESELLVSAISHLRVTAQVNSCSG
jgi:hypothetical protein